MPISINNVLHKDGTVNYYPNVLSHDDATRYFDLLLQKIGKMMKSLFLVSTLSQREKLDGMVILTTCIPIRIQFDYNPNLQLNL